MLYCLFVSDVWAIRSERFHPHYTVRQLVKYAPSAVCNNILHGSFSSLPGINAHHHHYCGLGGVKRVNNAIVHVPEARIEPVHTSYSSRQALYFMFNMMYT